VDKTRISWTNATWNPMRGCSRMSAGCEHCYAERMAARFSGPGQPYEGLTRLMRSTERGARWTGEVRFVREALDQPLRWRKPRRIFVDSMSDLFHERVTDEQIAAIFGVMAAAPRHTFQVLTKRSERAARWHEWVADHVSPVVKCHNDAGGLLRRDIACADVGAWPLPNVHILASCEDQRTADLRIPLLLQCPAVVRGVSLEPLLGPIDLAYFNGADSFGSMPGIDWVIVGGESGPGARPCDVAWIRSIVEQCRRAAVPCFVKQLGGQPMEGETVCDPHSDDRWPILGPKRGLFVTHSKPPYGDPRDWPADLRVQEYPTPHPSEVAR